MKLDGMVTITSDQPELIDRAAEILGTSFVEEPWFALWVGALDELGATPERKREIVVADILGEFRSHARYQSLYATEDFAGVVGGYLASESAGLDHMALEEEGALETLLPILTPEEGLALSKSEQWLEPVSDFNWASDAAEEDGYDDFIYFYAWAVDVDARGTGAFRRMTQPFFDYADAHGIPCYLECYSDRLQAMYEHVGFEVAKIVSQPDIPITQRRMIRKPLVR